jgi:hypothetical protein
MTAKRNPEQPRNVPLGFRMTEAMRDRLEASAKASGRSLAREVEFHIRRSFEIDAMLERKRPFV